MNEFLQIIGSVASIASIPLAVFLYLRQREAKYRRLRSEISRTLSYKIGEDSDITLFELESVIEAKSREYGTNSITISPDGIVENLVSETISNPMLDSDRKKKVVDNLHNIHTASVCYRILNDYSAPISDSLLNVVSSLEIEPSTKKELEEKASREIKQAGAKTKPAFEILSTTFGFLAAIIATISATLGFTTFKELIAVFNEKPQLLAFIIGLLSSMVAALFTSLMVFKGKKRKKPLNESKK